MYEHIFRVLKDSEDENDDEQKQDVHGDSHSDQRHVKVPSREESKRNENSQRESEQRHDNVPLRDSNEDIRRADREPGVQVVAPTENTMNKWANIIKVNSSFDTAILDVQFFRLFCLFTSKRKEDSG